MVWSNLRPSFQSSSTSQQIPCSCCSTRVSYMEYVVRMAQIENLLPAVDSAKVTVAPQATQPTAGDFGYLLACLRGRMRSSLHHGTVTLSRDSHLDHPTKCRFPRTAPQKIRAELAIQIPLGKVAAIRSRAELGCDRLAQGRNGAAVFLAHVPVTRAVTIHAFVDDFMWWPSVSPPLNSRSWMNGCWSWDFTLLRRSSTVE